MVWHYNLWVIKLLRCLYLYSSISPQLINVTTNHLSICQYHTIEMNKDQFYPQSCQLSTHLSCAFSLELHLPD